MARRQMRQLPSNLEAEKALLCACFLKPEIIPQVRAQVQQEDFYTEAHRLVFEAICSLGNRTDPMVVSGYLKAKGLIDKAGGDQALMALSDYVFTSAGWAYHAGIVKDKATRRAIIKTCEQAAESAYGSTGFPEEILSALKDKIRRLNTDTEKPYRDNVELVNSVWSDIERKADHGDRFVGIPTGFRGIDDHVFGLEPKTTTYLIARPSAGKTALALNIAENIQGRVLFFSLESNAEAITRRRMAARSKVFLWRIRTAQLDDGQYNRLLDTCNELCESQVIIFDKPSYRWIENLTAQCESMAMDGPIGLIVIGHIGRCKTQKKAENQNILLGLISEEISDLAKNLNVPILVLCQLNREIEKRPIKDQYPRLSDIRESGRIEENADNVVGLYRQNKETEDVRLEWLKGRDVGTFVTCLKFDRLIQKFRDSDNRPEDTQEERKRREW